MIGKTVPRFWDMYNVLPSEVKTLAKKAYRQWKTDPHQGSLNFERLGKNLWSVRVGSHYRVLGRKSADTEDGEEVFIWHWIGTHAEYDRLIKQR